MCGSKVRLLLLLPAVVLAGCACGGEALPAASPVRSTRGAVVADKTRCEVRFPAVVQRTDAPRMNDWAQAIPALLGARGGQFEEYFVFLADVSVRQVYDAMLELGARSRPVYRTSDVAAHKGLRPDDEPADYMQGDPVQIFVEWRQSGRTRRLAYEDFFDEKIIVGDSQTVKPWTPHFVFHGSGVLNKKRTGCIACTHDCPGGIIGNNQYPLVKPSPMLRAQWRRLPRPGTRVTVVIRPVASAAD